MKRLALIVTVILSSVASSTNAKTFAQVPSATNDVNAALIRELHDLRLAIEKLATANSRVQVLAARASQREQRISTLMTELITLNGKLAQITAETSFGTAVLAQLRERLRTEADPKHRAELEDQQADLVADVNHKTLNQSFIQAQVDSVRQQILTEQSNLADIERKLDELDRPGSDSQR